MAICIRLRENVSLVLCSKRYKSQVRWSITPLWGVLIKEIERNNSLFEGYLHESWNFRTINGVNFSSQQ